MSKFKEYDVEEIDALCSLGKALSSPIRIEIMQLLYEEGMIIGDIAKKTGSAGIKYGISSEDPGRSRVAPYGKTAGNERNGKVL